MKLAIMQPYFLPYIGYFQLIAAVDTFILYNNIKYTKKGWINRNRMLVNGAAVTFSIPLQKDSDSLDIVQRRVAAGFDRARLLNQFRGAYGHAPFFSSTFPLLERIIKSEEENLFRYIYSSLLETCKYLGLDTRFLVSSELDLDHDLKGESRVRAICRVLGAEEYINPIGGTELYSKEAFERDGTTLRFLESKMCAYPQFEEPHVPSLSIVDVLMFNPLDVVRSWIAGNYELI